ncbi:MAG TPA: DUF2398 family protein, partial [Longimicrobiales bacterium]|nr:DUF2398 family protein [Longimicrobiales bacterium]
IVAVLRWMIETGLARELHETVNRYATDAEADAVLRMRPDRISLLSLPALVGAEAADDVVERASRRDNTRQWLRGRLVEDPVVYQGDLAEAEWAELRRRIGEEERLAEEMFGLVLEARAEGVAAVDPEGTLTEDRFPVGGTLGHATLLLVEKITEKGGRIEEEGLVEAASALAAEHSSRWSNEMVESPHRLAQRSADLLIKLRLARGDDGTLLLLPAAARFLAVEEPDEQTTLW